jgi:hypothetical protein
MTGSEMAWACLNDSNPQAGAESPDHETAAVDIIYMRHLCWRTPISMLKELWLLEELHAMHCLKVYNTALAGKRLPIECSKPQTRLLFPSPHLLF